MGFPAIGAAIVPAATLAGACSPWRKLAARGSAGSAISPGMSLSGNITMGRDPTGRLFVATCLRCGHLVAASGDKRAVEMAAANHQCELKSTAVARPDRPLR